MVHYMRAWTLVAIFTCTPGFWGRGSHLEEDLGHEDIENDVIEDLDCRSELRHQGGAGLHPDEDACEHDDRDDKSGEPGSLNDTAAEFRNVHDSGEEYTPP